MAGLGLETDMSQKQTGSVDDGVGPNEYLTVAPCGVPSHPANEAFVKGMEAVLMKTISADPRLLFQSTANLSACLQIYISRWLDMWIP